MAFVPPLPNQNLAVGGGGATPTCRESNSKVLKVLQVEMWDQVGGARVVVTALCAPPPARVRALGGHTAFPGPLTEKQGVGLGSSWLSP